MLAKTSRVKQVLSLTLALLLCFSCAAPAFAADVSKEPTPIIYVIGRTTIYNHLSDPANRQKVPSASGSV